MPLLNVHLDHDPEELHAGFSQVHQLLGVRQINSDEDMFTSDVKYTDNGLGPAALGWLCFAKTMSLHCSRGITERLYKLKTKFY